MSQRLPIINNTLQQFGTEFCECNMVAPKMYYVKFKRPFSFYKYVI